MPDASIIERGPSLRTPAPLPYSTRPDNHSTGLVTWSGLPRMRSGQLWVTRLASAGPESAPLEYAALTTASVVIYDRALAPIMARFLPLGGYAEPAVPSEDGIGATSARCVRFARDGWSVARLVQPGGEFRHPSELALSLEMPPNLQVTVFANLGGGVYETSEVRLDELILFDRSSSLTVICDAIKGDLRPNLSVASTNGLAG
jgi:hypothetical protein